MQDHNECIITHRDTCLPMSASKRPLNVFLYCTMEDLPIAHALYERLLFDGVNVVQPDLGILEIDSDEAEDSPRVVERKDTIKKAVDEADVVLFCLSKEFNRLSALGSEWQFVLDAALRKKQGNIAVLPVRLEDCTVPQALKRWLTVDLQSLDGYEKLMLAMKLRADKVNAGLLPDESWRESFYETVPDTDSADTGSRFSMTWIVILLVMVGVAAMLIAGVADGIFIKETASPADVLAENATKNALSAATNEAATATAAAFIIGDPFTQTAVYRTTTEPLAMSAGVAGRGTLLSSVEIEISSEP